MAAKKEKPKQDRNAHLKTLGSATFLLAIIVQIVGGIMVGARASKILYRCGVTSVVILSFFAVIIWVMSRYEEIHSGKA